MNDAPGEGIRPGANQAPRQTDRGIVVGLLADVQYADADPWRDRYYRCALGRLDACLAHFTRLQLDMVVNLGDLIDHDEGGFDRVLSCFAAWALPVYHVVGNHDWSVSPSARSGVRARLGIGRGYRAIRQDGWCFIFLDGTELSTYANAPGSPGHEAAQVMLAAIRHAQAPQAESWNGGIGPDQLAWLDAELSRADASRERVAIFSHFPIYPTDRHNLWNDRQLLDCIHDHVCVSCWLAAHDHAGRYACHREVHHLTLKGMVQTAADTAYALLRFETGRIVVTGFGREEDRVMVLR